MSDRLLKESDVIETFGERFEFLGIEVFGIKGRDLARKMTLAIPSADRPQGDVDAVDIFEREMHNLEQGYITLGEFDERIEPLRHLCYGRPQGEWIPCSERLPKKEEATYLICTEGGYMCSCRWTNDMYGLGSNEYSEWGWHIMDKPQYAKVVAWMEMEPWKGADDVLR